MKGTYMLIYFLVQFYINKLLDNNYYAGLMTLITLYALFGDDIRVIATEKDEDPYFWGFSSFAFAAFMIEIALSSIAKVIIYFTA